MSDTVETWRKRVANWRASGQTAEEFSKGRPWSVHTFRRWASRLRRESTGPAPAPVVRVAQMIRSTSPREAAQGLVVIEALDARVRVTVDAAAPAETIAAVLGILVTKERR